MKKFLPYIAAVGGTIFGLSSFLIASDVGDLMYKTKDTGNMTIAQMNTYLNSFITQYSSESVSSAQRILIERCNIGGEEKVCYKIISINTDIPSNVRTKIINSLNNPNQTVEVVGTIYE